MASFAMLLMGTTAAAHATPSACPERLLPPSQRAATGQRPVTIADLVELRDFGRLDSGSDGRPSFSVSPDGRYAAVALRRADVASNSYCFGIAVVALGGSGGASLVDTGGEFISTVADIRGVPAIPSGVPLATAPLWAADGQALYYLRRDRGITQVWEAAIGGKARPLTRLDSDALSLEWASDGRTLLFRTRPALKAAQARIAAEGRDGYHFDARFWTLFEAKPRPALPLAEEIGAIDTASGDIRTLSQPEATALRSNAANRAPGASLFARSAAGNRAWTVADDPRRIFAPERLHVETMGRELLCPAEICRRRIVALWWQGATELFILRGGGPEDRGRLALYRWDIATESRPRLRFTTEDALMNCTPWRDSMLCARETARQPRTLARIDLRDGRATTLFDPNPEFAALRLGSVERLSWINAQGMRTYGDLVLPPDHRPGQRHPLIVVQYTSKGMLRGGSGDEYPIYLLARHGFAVLSFQRPGVLPETYAAADINAIQRINIASWAERRAIFSALDKGIDAAVASGAVDQTRIGITGMSDGATTTQFALNNSSRFKAAALSSCCDEPSGLFTVGPAYRDAVLAWGYPRQATDNAAFWKPLSLAANAPTMRTPLLIQVPDAEYRWSLETVSALEQHGSPVDMFVFPKEYHVKSQPAHRAAIYARAVRWFEFWLLGGVSEPNGHAVEIARWQAMRSKFKSVVNPKNGNGRQRLRSGPSGSRVLIARPWIFPTIPARQRQ